MRKQVLSLSIAAMIGGLQYANVAVAMPVKEQHIVPYFSEHDFIDYNYYIRGVV